MVRISGGAVAARVRKMQMASGEIAAVARNWTSHHHPQLGHVERGDEQDPVDGDADPGHDQRPLGCPPEHPVADHVGHGQSHERGQTDDRVDLAPLRRVEAPPPGEVEIAEERAPGAGEPQDGHRHQLEVDRADPEQPGTAEPSSTRGASPCWVWMSMPDAFRMWLDSFGPLSGSRSREQGQGDGHPGEGDQHSPPPTVAEVTTSRTSGCRRSGRSGPRCCAS